jgi:hypothetical protein
MLWGGGLQPLVPCLLLGPPFFSDYSFWVHHLVNQDGQQLLAHAMASDFSVTWLCRLKRTIGFSLRIKLYADFYKCFPVGMRRRVFFVWIDLIEAGSEQDKKKKMITYATHPRCCQTIIFFQKIENIREQCVGRFDDVF